MIRAVAIVLLSALVILTRQLTSDIGTAVAEGPGGGRGSGSERGGNGGGGAAAASAGGAGISDAAGVSSSASSSVDGNVSVSASAASAGGREDPPGTRTDLSSAIAQGARDAARYAVDASRVEAPCSRGGDTGRHAINLPRLWRLIRSTTRQGRYSPGPSTSSEISAGRSSRSRLRCGANRRGQVFTTGWGGVGYGSAVTS